MLLLQAAAQHLPPINVTVQQPAGGMPEWVKILISAGVGALFGILSSIAMEYLKPYIAKRFLRKTVSAQVGAELVENLGEVEAAYRILEDAKNKSTDARRMANLNARMIGSSRKFDRYDHYFAEEKSVLYEIDEQQTLAAFNGALRSQSFSGAHDSDELQRFFFMAAALGRLYITQHKLVFNPRASAFEDTYRGTLADSDADQFGKNAGS
jgi:hypothetical protein